MIYLLFVIGIVAAVFPLLIGWILVNIFSSAPEPSPTYKCFWAFISGISVTYAVNCAYIIYQLPNVSTSTLIADAFNKAWPYLIIILAICIAIAGLSRCINSDKQIKQQSMANIAAQKNEADEEMKARFKAMDLSLRELKLKARDDIAQKRAVFAKELQQFEQQKQKCNEAFELKKQAYLEENNGLRSSRDRLKEEIKVKDEIIHWIKEGNVGALERAEKKLRKIHKSNGCKSAYSENSEGSDSAMA